MPTPARPDKRRPTYESCKTFVVQWFQVNWLDLLCMAAVGAISAGVWPHLVPLPASLSCQLTLNA